MLRGLFKFSTQYRCVLHRRTTVLTASCRPVGTVSVGPTVSIPEGLFAELLTRLRRLPEQ